MKLFSLVRALSVSALLFALPAAAVDVRISGYGTRSCTDWLAWKNEASGESRAMGLVWAQGFITGHNIYAPALKGGGGVVVADNKVLLTLLDAYCQKAPNSRLLNGVIDITRSLGGTAVNLNQPGAPASAPRPAEGDNRPAI